MKVEGGVATTTILHKVKVKEEAKECCGYQQLSSTSVPASSTSTGTGTVATATAPNTTIVTTVDGNTNINNVNANGNGNGVVPAATTAPSTTVLPNDSPATTAAIICHPSTPASSVTVTVTANAEPFPVDLDLKAKAKVCTATREKPSREDGQPEVHSPSSQHQRVSTVVGSGQQKQSNGPRSEYKGATGCSGSSDNDSPLSSLTLKPEFEDGIGSGVGGGGGSGGGGSGPVPANCRTEEQNDVPPLSNGTAGTRCIAGVFAGHGMFKRLLGTLVQFATDISPDTGDTVRTLVLALLSGSMAAEEFHQALQEATNYRLRGFVLPYLKHTLPSLQRDLGNAARASNQSSAQFLRSNETAVLEAVGLVSSSEPVEIFGEQAGSGNGGNQCSAHYGMRSNSNPGVGGIQHTGNATGGLHHYSRSEAHAPKRRASDTPYYENGVLFDDVPVYGKRLSNPWSHHHAPQQQQQQTSTESSGSYCWYHPLHSSNGSMQGHGHRHGHGPSPVPPSLVQINQINAFSGTHHLTQQQQQQQQPPSHAQMQNGSLDDEWKNIHVMLNCILGMVEKTKRALTILQTRGCSSPAAVPPLANASAATQNGTGNSAAGNNLSSTNGSQAESSTGDREGSLKRLSGEIVAQTIKATEDKVAEVKRKAEEAVLEVKRAAVAEVQRAVAAAVAESRASERLRVHRMLDLPMSQRNHIRQGPFLRVHSDTNGRTVATPTTTSNSAASTTEDEKDGHMQSISGSNCWNCGRPALETCGGCGIARYCGSFCQHRDWEAGGHHATCNNPPTRDSSRSASRSPPRIVSGANDAEVAAPATVTTPSKGK